MSSNFPNRRYTVSKHSGPTYANSYALKDITVQYRNPTSTINPISLPTGWTQPRLEDNFGVNLALEASVLEQAAARRQAIIGEVPDPNSSLRVSSAGMTVANVPLIPYQSSGMLIPVPVSSESQVANTNTDDVTNPLGEMSLRDFEGDSNDPFESTALQAIDVFSELQSVLQPELSNTAEPRPQPRPPPPPSNHKPPSPKPTSTALPSYSFIPPTSVPQNSIYSTSAPPTGPRNVSQPPPRPPVGGVGVLVDFGRPNQIDTPPSTVSTAGQSSFSPSTTSQPQQASPVPQSNPRPVVLPKPHRPRYTPPAAALSGSLYSGVPVLPPIEPEVRPPPYSETPYASEELYITVPSNAHRSSVPNVTSFQLPDIQSSLTPDEREAVVGISGMGFPTPRVARAMKHFDGDSQKILDFLVLVGECEDKGHSGDSAETALLAHDQDKEKSLEYLCEVARYKEVWPEQSIHDAYQESGKDWDKTVDILTQGRS